MKSKGKHVMKIERIRTLNGPNVYSYRPVLLMSLDLGELVERESREFKGFNERLLKLLPGIQNHHCSLGRPGGFITRLEEGTYFGHVVEHVALELTELAGIGKSHGKTRHDTGSLYNVAIEFRAEKASTYLPRRGSTKLSFVRTTTCAGVSLATLQTFFAARFVKCRRRRSVKWSWMRSRPCGRR